MGIRGMGIRGQLERLGQLGVHKDELKMKENLSMIDNILGQLITVWVTMGSNDSWVAYTDITLANR